MPIINDEPDLPVTVTIPQPGCCDLDSASRQALIAYYLSLILKHIGGADLTNCEDAVEEFASVRNYDESHLELIQLEMLTALMTLTGTTIPDYETAKSAALCLRNNLPIYGLKSFQFVLWDEIVNEYIP